MANKMTERPIMFAIAASLLILCSCASGGSKPSTFYLLKALPEKAPTEMSAGGITVVVDPVVFPAYLDRSQLTTTGDDHKLTVDEFSRWAEPLKENFSRVLAENLSILLKSANIYSYPQRPAGALDAEVTVSVTRFAMEEGTAVLVAYWSIFDSDNQVIIPRQRAYITDRATSKTVEAMVSAQNTVLQKFSQEIAAAIHSH